MPAALFQSVNADGWSATYASPPTFAPTVTPEYFTVTRPGFDVTGAATNVVEDLICMARLRQPYPSQASLTADQVVLSDFVYVGETVSGAVNNSTRAAPLPIPRWLNRDREICTGNTYHAMLAVAHAYARNGKPVAAVKFIATDGSTTVEQVVTAMSLASYSASGFSLPHYAADLDFTGFANGATITIDAIIYPWIGAAFQASVHGSAYPSPNFTTLRVLNNRTGAYGTAYACVDPVSGVDASGVTSATRATAVASPYLTIAAAAAAIKTFNNANFARNFSDGGVVLLKPGSTVLTASILSTAATSNWPLTIEAENPALIATTILTDRGSTLANSIPTKLVLRNITLKRSGAGSFVFLDNAAANLTFTNILAFENCHFDANGTAVYDGWIYKTGLCYYTNCTQNGSVGQTILVGLISKATITLGCNGAFVGPSSTYSVLASKIVGTFAHITATVGLPASAGGMCGWSLINQPTNGSKVIAVNDPVGPRGFAAVAAVFEQSGGITGPVLSISADGIVQAAENILMMCVTAVGARSNFGYQDTGSTTIPKSLFHRFSSHDDCNTKSDVFGANANLIGNWPVIYKVGARGNAARRGDSNSGSAPGVGNWLGEIAALGEVSGSDAVPLSLPWGNDKSFLGAGGGFGDYTPTSGTQLPLIPAASAPWSHDFMGRAIANDGTAKAGALQMLATGASGDAAGTLPLTGAAQGATLAQGAASGDIAITGAAQGAVLAAGGATGSVSFIGASSGVTTIVGAVAGFVAFTGAAIGAANVNGAASGALPLTGAASGVTGATAIGAAAGVIGLSGAATGEAPAIGSGAGVIAFAGSGQAQALARGFSAGAITFAGASVGVTLIAGTASGGIAFSGTATGGVPVAAGALAMYRVPATWRIHETPAAWKLYSIPAQWRAA